MTIHEGFTSIHQACLVDRVRRELRRAARPVGAPHHTDTLNRPDSVIDGASVSFQAA